MPKCLPPAFGIVFVYLRVKDCVMDINEKKIKIAIKILETEDVSLIEKTLALIEEYNSSREK
jgi:hypothetical protein